MTDFVPKSMAPELYGVQTPFSLGTTLLSTAILSTLSWATLVLALASVLGESLALSQTRRRRFFAIPVVRSLLWARHLQAAAMSGALAVLSAEAPLYGLGSLFSGAAISITLFGRELVRWGLQHIVLKSFGAACLVLGLTSLLLQPAVHGPLLWLAFSIGGLLLLLARHLRDLRGIEQLQD